MWSKSILGLSHMLNEPGRIKMFKFLVIEINSKL